MYRDNKICVIVTAFNEEILIARTINTIPEYVDRIVVVDDCSTDNTQNIVEQIKKRNSRVHYIRHDKNNGVGAAITTGFLWSKENNTDITVIMNGDSQMDPVDLPDLLNPIVDNKTDFSKGNRFASGKAWNKIPHIRYLGNSALSLMTKIASGYWHVTDSQSGYIAINKRALESLPLEYLYKGFGVPNEILVRLNIANMRVTDVPINSVYGIGEKSSIKIHKVTLSIFILIIRLFFRRMFQKYIIRDFHPLIILYAIGITLLLMAIPLSFRLFTVWAITARIPMMNALAILFCTFAGMQSLLFAMLFDMETNMDLKGKSYTDSH